MIKSKKYIIIDENVVLNEYDNDEAKSGCYSFPFKIGLPDALPCTARNGKFRIKYKLIAKMAPLKGKKSILYEIPIQIYDDRTNSDI